MDRRFEGWSGRRGAGSCALLLATIAALSACGGQTGQDSSSAPSFGSPRDYAPGTGSVAIDDLNGDGKPDLVTGNAGGGVSVLLNRGDGSFQAKRDYPAGAGPSSVAIGDLSGDGKPDLGTANWEASSVSVLVNRGDGSFRAKRDYATGRSPNSVAIGDLNGDRKPDLVTANEIGNTVSVLANRGDGSFQVRRDYASGSSPYSVAIGDLNGDRKPDLATANSYANSVSVLVNATGHCVVPNVKGKILPIAKRTIARADCRVGKIAREHSKRVKGGRVLSQKPRPGTVLPKRGKVELVVSRGRKR